ncbi:glycoside hydrolase TIM-barrel-like domain-containing protein [Rhodobacteraceae bacterium B1Z28]|uniref:Glycoside hydrolase TIM-barrel-like domain-containing protein n=1 Tax=Ruegeria haliotis TaxID=2747601 RepID=A0ABX2PNB9_9RHOB|nr:glycoside hydrolase/phage tail family protein [Ruegeria haliotis]NVO55613.1 glycoside hydrolase TIM-barrel-like domain-containing protein [Ruegeria haliotis]
MATILLSAAGAALGGSIGGTVAGLSTAVIGRAVGATLGRVIDQRLMSQSVMGGGSEVVETGRLDRFRLTETGEGASVATTFGRMRVGGQVIWASDFLETRSSTTEGGGGGKGSPKPPKVTTVTYSYSVSLAIAVGAGEIADIARIWADGEEQERAGLNMRIYRGTDDQLPDPLIEAIEGGGTVPAYRGTAYVVIEDFQLSSFGNRVPQFSFEVVRPAQPGMPDHDESISRIVRAVALMPGTGEYALASSQVNYSKQRGTSWAANVNSASGLSDLVTSTRALEKELPGCEAASLIVSWFGGDLRCGACQITPKVVRDDIDGKNMPWSVSGLKRKTAQVVRHQNDRPVYGGTPADASVVEAIRHLKATGKRVMFYPFILMDQLQGNGLSDPWSDATNQPHLPWRGRITLDIAPGQTGSPDQTAAADAQVAAFFGQARASDFVVGAGTVQYRGPDEWGLRRFILHYAALCKAAGGVNSFCIASEMRGLTQIRGLSGFPAVAQLRGLAAEVRQILGPDTKIGYAADWSEYFGYQPPGTSDRFFHLDPLWVDDNIDFIGIDNYMPLSDWREGEDHLDAASGAPSVYDLDYLRGNVEGGEGYDWYYASPEEAEAQIRTPIEDAEHGEPWIWRYKDLRNWWSNTHHERIGGVRQANPTDWVPGSKPIWFTELGCAAIDKGTNRPNKFLDPKSSESSFPPHSNGLRDDFIQVQYLTATLGYWADSQINPISGIYGAPMVDLSNAYVWAWDARPFPTFPNLLNQWSDGENYARGHWLNGRSGSRTLASVVTEICYGAGVTDIDVSALYGVVRGYLIQDVSDARSALQPLMLRYGFDAIERDGVLRFQMRDGYGAIPLVPDHLAVSSDLEGSVEFRREAEAEMTGRVRLRFVQSDADHDLVAEEAVLPDTSTHSVSVNEMPLSMTRSEGRQTAERWLSEARVSRDTARFALPPSQMHLGAGDVVRLSEDDHNALYRIDRLEKSDMQLAEAVRIEQGVYKASELQEDPVSVKPYIAPVPVLPVFMDLPLITGSEVPHAPYLAVSADPWPGSAAVFSSSNDENYTLSDVITGQAVIGFTETPLRRASAGIWDEGAALRVSLIDGLLESHPREALLNGLNLAAIGDGTPGNWEVFQFADATLQDPGVYSLSGRLRGQLGTDALMPDVWPDGSMFVLLNDRIQQTSLLRTERRVAKHYRIGPATRSYDDASYEHLVETFDGNGLRPYAPAHLRVRSSSASDDVSWIRRTRQDGDDWAGLDVPLGEESESYLLRVRAEGTLLREVVTAEPRWTYSTAMKMADGLTGSYEIEVAQVSAIYGPGVSSYLAIG